MYLVSCVTQNGDASPPDDQGLQSLIGLSAHYYWEQDEHFRFTRILGPTATDAPDDFSRLIGITRWDSGAVPVSDGGKWDNHRLVLQAHLPFSNFVYSRVNSRGELQYFSSSGQPQFDAHGCFRGYRGITKDITQDKRAEEAAWRLTRMYDTLNTTNEAIMRSQSPEELFARVCAAAVQGAKFMIASILVPDVDGWLKLVAVEGLPKDPVREARVSIDPQRPEGRGLVGAAMRTCQPCVSNNYMADDRTRPWHWLSRAYNVIMGSAAAVPILRNGSAIGAISFFTAEKNSFDQETVALLQRMAENVAFALDNFERESERRAAEEALRASEARFQALTDLCSDWYWEQDQDLRLSRIEGPHVVTLLGDVASIQGKYYWDVGLQAESDWETFRALLERHEPFRDFITYRDLGRERRYLALSGEPLFSDDNTFIGYRGVGRDVTAQIVAEERIQYLSTHDGLTGLPNRAMFTELLNHEIHSARRYQRKFAVIFIDLDRFKVINDTLGHEAGDALLRETCVRLQECLRASDVVARLGGDEFVILVQEANDPNEVVSVARRILSAVIRPIMIQGQECRVTASIGIALFPDNGEDERVLMKNADIAMYLAKQEGKNNFQFYSDRIKTQSLERLALETSLRHALERSEFSLHYQAKVELANGRITGVEALLRWHHPQLGLVSPAQFIPLAEETGMIVPIGKWVLMTACAQNVAWQKQGLPPVCMAVNLSMRQFAEQQLLDDIKEALAISGLAPHLLELEITEGMVMQDTERAVKLLSEIKRLGVRLAIDDFGTGYSSLAQIKRFPIDTIKVDRSFIREIPRDAEDKAITEAIIAMGKTLSLTVVAEGVETSEQEQFLKERACDEMQGYYFSKPIIADDFAALLAKHSEKTAAIK